MVIEVPQSLGGVKKLNDGNLMPMIGLGISRITEQQSLMKAVETALAAGYRLFDTAHIYENEKELGEALQVNLKKFGLSRSDIFITTKVPTMDEDTEEWVEKHIEESLKKLQTDYLDLVLVHYPRDRYIGQDGNHEINKRGRRLVWKQLEKAKENGTIRSIGVSNYTVFHLAEMDEYATIKPAVNQTEFHPYLTIDQVRHYCSQRDIFIQAFSSLCWGNQEVLNENAIQKLSAKYAVTPQIILYTFALNAGIGIIPKSATPSRIISNIKETACVQLEDEELNSLFTLDRNVAFCPRCEPWKCL